ncbi:MAG TPA: HAD-IA family hydrolase [Polyangiaceae bacterium]|mgnify:CR=1 FL=1|nr:HAD-IA family hydrolase [Polyangiaceae bacterium]
MLAPRVIVFDLDGTLLDTSPDLALSCNHALEVYGRTPLPVEEIQRYIGDGARRLMSRAARMKDDDPNLDGLVEEFIRHYQQYPVQRTTWMPYATHVLEELSEMLLAICTNKPRSITDAILDTLHASERFALVVGGGDLERNKPSPDPLRFTAKQLRVDPKELVMVGDGPQDVLAGKSVGARTIAVAAGYTSETFLRELHPDMLLDDLRTLPDIIQRWREATVRVGRSHASY